MARADEVFVALEALGATKVVASFSGGNDEGGYDDVSFFNGDDRLEVDFDIYNEYHAHIGPGKSGEPANKLRYKIAEFLAEYLDGQYGGFGFEGSVYGEVTVDTITRTAVVTGGEQEYVDFERSLY